MKNITKKISFFILLIFLLTTIFTCSPLSSSSTDPAVIRAFALNTYDLIYDLGSSGYSFGFYLSRLQMGLVSCGDLEFNIGMSFTNEPTLAFSYDVDPGDVRLTGICGDNLHFHIYAKKVFDENPDHIDSQHLITGVAEQVVPFEGRLQSKEISFALHAISKYKDKNLLNGFGLIHEQDYILLPTEKFHLDMIKEEETGQEYYVLRVIGFGIEITQILQDPESSIIPIDLALFLGNVGDDNSWFLDKNGNLKDDCEKDKNWPIKFPQEGFFRKYILQITPDCYFVEALFNYLKKSGGMPSLQKKSFEFDPLWNRFKSNADSMLISLPWKEAFYLNDPYLNREDVENIWTKFGFIKLK